jgi:GT2 family glycosyltransferase
VGQQPTFSIIIPTYNRSQQLTACLRAVARLDYPHECFEVIVADDGSASPLDGVVQPLRNELSLTLLRQANAGPATARNAGAAQARKQFLVFTDDDCVPAPDWLRTLAARFSTTPIDAVAGRTCNALPDNPYAVASQFLISSLFAYHNADPNQARFLISNNLAVPADAFRALGGFAPTFPFAGGEDWEFCQRWLAHGYCLRYAPEAVVYHAHQLSLRTFWRQHFRYGRGTFRVRQLKKQADHERGRQRRFAFHLQLLQYFLTHAWGRQTLRLAALLAVAQVANVSGLVWEWRQHNQEMAKLWATERPGE